MSKLFCLQPTQVSTQFPLSIPSSSLTLDYNFTSMTTIFHFCLCLHRSLYVCVKTPHSFSSSLLSPHHCHPPSQLNVSGLDWSQLSKKECLKYGGSLVGKSCKFVPDLALMSFILFFGTYSMTVSLKKFKFSRYFPTKVIK